MYSNIQKLYYTFRASSLHLPLEGPAINVRCLATMVEHLSVGMKLSAMYAHDGKYYYGEVVSLSNSAKKTPAPWRNQRTQ